MKKIAVCLVFMLAAGHVFSQEIKKVKIEDVMKMADTSSVPLVINFWATWCHPCVQELPWFEKSVAELKNKNVKLLLVSLDFAEDYPAGIVKFAKEHGYTSQIVWLNETDANAFCPKVDKTWEGTIPVTLMVNNKKHYRQFFNQQLPEPRLKLELQKLVE
ncbi:TlpA disulfide reductase family protein [Chitinophagaceae bacterium LWZ2-11]